MKKFTKTILKTMVLLSVFHCSAYAEVLITDTGVRNELNVDYSNEKADIIGINIIGKNEDVNQNTLTIDLNNEVGNLILKSRGNIYGINVSDKTNNAAYIKVNGDTLNIRLSGFETGENNNNFIGLWHDSSYNSVGGVHGQYSGGYIELNNKLTNIEIDTQQQGKGIIAGSDFGGNSKGAGKVILNGAVRIKINNDVKWNGSGYYRHVGVVACENGIIEANNDIDIDITSFSYGANYHEVAGLYTALNGKIVASDNSNINIKIKGEGKVAGISNGFYDILSDIDNPSEMNLGGNNSITLDSKNSIGVDAYSKGQINANSVSVNFIENENGQYTGVKTNDNGKINIKNLYIGTDESLFNDASKIVALKTDIAFAWYKDLTDEGIININCDDSLNTQNGTVQINGAIDANYSGSINVNLDNSQSYLFGNVQTEDTATTNLKIANSASWKNIGDSKLTSLDLSNNAVIDMTDKTYNGNFESITVNTFKGSGGVINMDIDASVNVDNSDRIYVDRTHSGIHYITLNNVGGGDTNGAEGTVLVSVKDEQGEFKANNSEGKLYWNKYTLDRITEDVTNGYTVDWILKEVEQIDVPTTSVETILGANALNYHTWRAESDKLMKRMGDLRHNGEDEKGAWFRARGSKISRSDNAAFENKYTAYELGYDVLDKETEKYKRYTGASLSYTDGQSHYNNGYGENDSKAISFYSTTMRNKGHYLDFVFKVVDMDNDFNVTDSNGNNIRGKNDNQGISLNVEYGRKKALGNDWYIEPQGQLTLGYLGGDVYTTSNGIKVDQGGISSLVGRIGFNIGKDVNEKTNLYFKANVLHEFLGDYSLNMTDTANGQVLKKDGSFKDTWYEIGVGAAVQTGKNNHLYFDVEKSFGGDFKKDWAWNAGMRWTF